MDTTIKCNNCDREIGYTLSTRTRGIVDTNMSGLATNFKIACPNCGQINWYPASGPKPKNINETKMLNENITKM